MSAPTTDGAAGRIAFVTYGGAPDMTADDKLACAALEQTHGLRVEAVAWDADAVDWSDFDAAVLRSTWDYHLRSNDFTAWAARVEAGGTPLWNPAAVVLWNADKRYLQDLERAGVPVVATEWIRRGESCDLRAALRAVLRKMERRGWDRVVVKPSVSASAHNTWLIDADNIDSHASRIAALLEDADALVQPFMPQVQREGEWSFVFLAGIDGGLAFSHAVLKRPSQGDFRVQDEFGGSHTSADPPVRLLREVEQAARRVEAVARVIAGTVSVPLLYARLDGIVTGDATGVGAGFMLMEAELIEPALFLGCGEAGARFAAAIAGQVTSSLRQLSRAARDQPSVRTAAEGALPAS